MGLVGPSGIHKKTALSAIPEERTTSEIQKKHTLTNLKKETIASHTGVVAAVVQKVATKSTTPSPKIAEDPNLAAMLTQISARMKDSENVPGVNRLDTLYTALYDEVSGIPPKIRMSNKGQIEAFIDAQIGEIVKKEREQFKHLSLDGQNEQVLLRVLSWARQPNMDWNINRFTLYTGCINKVAPSTDTAKNVLAEIDGRRMHPDRYEVE